VEDAPGTFEALQADLCEAYKQGRKGALLQAIELSILHRRPLPDWASEAFDHAYSFVMMGGAHSWDEVFGQPHPTGKHLLKIGRENRKFEVWRRVRQLHEEGAPIDSGLFERVGRETGLGEKTVISELYYKVEQLVRRMAAD
jgi:hypothetical protein